MDPHPAQTRLSEASLGRLGPEVERPAYERARVTPGIVHLGIGAFHRAHQAAAVETCLAAGDLGWGIVGASLRSPETRDALTPQDGLYTLALRGDAGERLRVIGAIGRVLVAPEAPHRLLDALADPRVRIVSLTVTEKGYTADIASGTLKRDHPDVVHDLANPQAPRTALGFLTEAIARRRAAGTAPFTVLSCDNLPHNGRTLHRVLAGFAAARDPDLGAFVAGEVRCPSSMVDRIVPATTDRDRAAVAARLGAYDAWPVVAEPFLQWVVEDCFPAGRPRLEEAGITFVTDVVPFEHMKLRLLNGAHSALAAIGRLAGLDTVADAVRQPALRAFLDLYWSQVIPTLTLAPESAGAYTRALTERFGNAALDHRTAQIASDASQKLPQRILAPLRDLLARPAPHDALVLAVAAFIRVCSGRRDDGAALTLNDPVFEAWAGRPDQNVASSAETVERFLAWAAVFGEDLPRHGGFVRSLTEALESIARHGALASVEALLAAHHDRGNRP